MAGATGSGSGTVSFSVAANNSTTARTGTLTIAGQTYTVEQSASTNSAVQFSAANYSVNVAEHKLTINVTRTGNTSVPASVDYMTTDGTADRRRDYSQKLGTLKFNPSETTKCVTIFITDDSFADSSWTIHSPSRTRPSLSSAPGAPYKPTCCARALLLVAELFELKTAVVEMDDVDDFFDG